MFVWSSKFPDYEKRMKVIASECAWYQTPVGQLELDKKFQLVPMELKLLPKG